VKSSLAELGETLAALRWETLSVHAREKLPLLLLDALGCAAAGARLNPYDAFVTGQPEDDEASIWFWERRSTTEHAALVNGSLAHHVEMDDGQSDASLHGGVTVIPAAIAVGEAIEASGESLLLAIAAGYAAAVACGRPLKEGINDHNLHPPSMVGCFGAAAAAASLLGHSAEETASALGLAGVLMPLGPFESFTRGATIKDLYGGWPAFVGVVAARYARHGLSGPLELFSSERDGIGRFLAHRAIGERLDLDLDDSLDVYIKPFATCRAVHASLTALEQLLPLDVEDISSIDVETYRFASELSHDSDPSTVIGAKTSIPYAVATLLLDGRVDPEAFAPEALKSSDRRRLAALVSVRHTLEQGARVTVTFRNAGGRTALVREARSETDVRAKFRRLAGEWAEPMERAVDSLRHQGLEPLLASLGPRSPKSPTPSSRAHPSRSMSTWLRDMARWVVDTRDVAPEARHAARRLIMDQIGVSLAGACEIPLRNGRPEATVWASGLKAHAPDAVLQNRIAGDDLELTAGPEIGAAAVAAAEIAGSSLRELLEAIAIASDVESYFRRWMQPGVEHHGLHPPAVFGAFSAATVSARLLGLDADELVGALASAAALAPQSPYVAFSSGVTGKWLYGAFSQKLGLSSALWARQGIVGPDSVFDGRRGIVRAFFDGPSERPGFAPGDWAITKVTFKPYPSSRACHAALTAVEKLSPLDADSIERVEILSYPFSVELEHRSQGDSHIAAQMSVRRAIALFLARGTLDWTALSHPKVADLKRRTTVTSNEAPAFPRTRRAKVRITLTDGRLLSSESDAKWSESRPATDEELRARFLRAARGRKVPDLWEAPDHTRVRDLFMRPR
jgi:2-methylcitrate dehydratase PrpD